MTVHPHFDIQGNDDGRPGEPQMKYGPSLVVCRACKWGQWSPKEGEEPGGRYAAGVAHVAAVHPAFDGWENLDTGALLEDLLQKLSDAARPGCCHTTGEHDPSHFTEGKYLCEDQKAQAWHRVILLLGLDHYNSPEAAQGCPDTCYWCRSKEVAA